MADDALIQQLLARIDQLESRNAMRDLVTDYCQSFINSGFDILFLAQFSFVQQKNATNFRFPFSDFRKTILWIGC